MSKNEIGGVWRTVGGRRIFIKDGQDLATAMKESGKFKIKSGANKKYEGIDEETKKEALNKIKKEVDNFKWDDEDEKKVQEDLKKEREKQSGKKWNDWSDDDEIMSVDDYKKEYGNDITRLKRELAQNERYLDEDSEGYKEAKKSIENGYKYLNRLKKEKEPTTYFEGKKDIENEVRQIYAEEGSMATNERNLKYISEKYGIPKTQAKAFIEDTGKRFDEENRIANLKSYENQKKYSVDGKTMTEYDLKDEYKKQWRNANIDEDMTYEQWKKSVVDTRNSNVKSDTGIKETDRVKRAREENKQWRDSLNDTKYAQEQLDKVYKNEDYTEVVNHLSQSELRKMKQAASDMNLTTPGTPGYNNAREYIQKMENKAAAKFLDKQIQQQIDDKKKKYRIAFNEYKLAHPNTDLNLEDFIKIAEGGVGGTR